MDETELELLADIRGWLKAIAFLLVLFAMLAVVGLVLAANA